MIIIMCYVMKYFDFIFSIRVYVLDRGGVFVGELFYDQFYEVYRFIDQELQDQVGNYKGSYNV